MKAKNAEIAKKLRVKEEKSQIPGCNLSTPSSLLLAARFCSEQRQPKVGWRWGSQTGYLHGRNRKNYKELPYQKSPDPDGFTMVCHPIFKHQITPELFKSIERKENTQVPFLKKIRYKLLNQIKTVQTRKPKTNITNEYQSKRSETK